jgi:hypothetical protein
MHIKFQLENLKEMVHLENLSINGTSIDRFAKTWSELKWVRIESSIRPL